MKPSKNPWLLRGGVVALALVVGLIAWLRTSDNDEPTAAAEATPATRIVSVAELRSAAAASGQPVYWAGPMPGKDLELVELGEGGFQVLYVPAGTEPEESPPAVLTIGSYPLANATEAVEVVAGRPGSATHRASDGREVVVSASSPTSAYFASPDNSVQVEVYDPSPKRALALALSERVRPAG